MLNNLNTGIKALHILSGFWPDALMTELIHSVIGVPARPLTAWQHLAGPGPVVRCGYQSAAEGLQPSAAAYGDSPEPGRQPIKLRIQSQSFTHITAACCQNMLMLSSLWLDRAMIPRLFLYFIPSHKIYRKK